MACIWRKQYKARMLAGAIQPLNFETWQMRDVERRLFWHDLVYEELTTWRAQSMKSSLYEELTVWSAHCMKSSLYEELRVWKAHSLVKLTNWKLSKRRVGRASSNSCITCTVHNVSMCVCACACVTNSCITCTVHNVCVCMCVVTSLKLHLQKAFKPTKLICSYACLHSFTCVLITQT
jgi:hypothetical protein